MLNYLQRNLAVLHECKLLLHIKRNLKDLQAAIWNIIDLKFSLNN